MWGLTASAEQTDVTQTPNAENAGIRKSLAQEVGAGRGDIMTPGSSLFIIARDPARSVRRGRQIFQRKFTVAQGFGPRVNDGIGNISADARLGAGLVDSCAGCHARPRGSAGFGGDVATRPDSRDAPHLFGLGLQEMIADEITTELRQIRTDAIADAAASHHDVTRALVGKTTRYGKITAHPDGTVDTSQVEGVNPDLRVRPFFAQGGTISIREFLVGAFQAEMGLQANDPDLYAASHGARVVTPSGMVLDGSLDAIEGPPVSSATEDGDHDGVANEIDTAIVDHEEFYLLNYFKPGTGKQTIESTLGRIILQQVGCTDCHTPNQLIDRDRRVADLETVFDPDRGVFNRLFATATLMVTVEDDGSGFPAIKRPAGNSFLVRNIFSDFKRHDLGPNFYERNYDKSLQKTFMTEALWGVASTGPYGHDGRSISLEEVILRHGGEAQVSRDRFAALPPVLRGFVFDFLNTLILFPPDDTASTLQPADPTNPTFPQRGHGSIFLTALFNDTTDVE
jgi:Di-haem oxidoreductase, putative peroxidase